MRSKDKEKKYIAKYCKTNNGPLNPSLNTAIDDVKLMGLRCSVISLEHCLKEVQKPHPRRVLEMIMILSKIKDHKSIHTVNNPSAAYDLHIKKEKDIAEKLVRKILETIAGRKTE